MKKLTLLISFLLFFSLISVIPFSNTVKATITSGVLYHEDFTGVNGILPSEGTWLSSIKLYDNFNIQSNDLKIIYSGATGGRGQLVFNYDLTQRLDFCSFLWNYVDIAGAPYEVFDFRNEYNQSFFYLDVLSWGVHPIELLNFDTSAAVTIGNLNVNSPYYFNFSFFVNGTIGFTYTKQGYSGYNFSAYYGIGSPYVQELCYNNVSRLSYITLYSSTSLSYWVVKDFWLRVENISGYYLPPYLPPSISLDEFYSNKGYNVHTRTYVQTDKNVYQYGEVVAIRYKTPTVTELASMSQYTGGWLLGAMKNKDWAHPNPASGDFSFKQSIISYGTWQYTSFLPSQPHNLDYYGLYIEHDQFGWFGIPWFPVYLFTADNNGATFQVIDNGIPFVAHGNITNITPNVSRIGDTVNIYYNANNNCSITIREISESPENYRDFQPLGKPPGTIGTTYIPDTLGHFIVELKVFNGLINVLVDSAYFNVTDTGNVSGSYGYASEYLYIPGECFISGHDTVSISYHSLKNNTKLTVTDSYEQRTPYSTNITDHAGILSIKLLPNAKIGQWKVVMYGLETLRANFSVIAEEGNYIEFTKNVFWNTEPLSVTLQHTHKSLLVFYKNGIPQGENLLFPVGFISTGTFVVPIDKVPISIGSWRVELWLTNNLTRIRLLSMATCIVETAPYERPNTSLYGFDIQSLPILVKIVIAFVIIIVMSLLPMLVCVMLSKGNISIEIPSLVYVAFFFTGIIVDVLLGLLEIYVLAIVLFGLILTIVITWLIQSRGSKT